MADKRRFRRISVYLKIKEFDKSPRGVGNLLNISASGAQIETTTMYRVGDLIKFNYTPPGPSTGDIEIHQRKDGVWGIPTGLFREKLISGRVVWVLPHPDKANHFLLGLDYSTKRIGQHGIVCLIIPLIIAAAGVGIALQRPGVLYDHIQTIIEWFLSPLKAMQAVLSKLLPF